MIKLFVSSEVPITKIFADDPSAKNTNVSDHMRSVMDDLVCLVFYAFPIYHNLYGDL